MITFTRGNLLEADVEALVNTVNTVGVMGKGIALMFKERFPQNFKLYSDASKSQSIEVGRMFVTETNEIQGPRWIVNFPTKQHWRSPSKIEWIRGGLKDLASFLVENNVKSVAIPPLGAGNGGLAWQAVRNEITKALGELHSIEVIVYEPTREYQNIAKRQGVETLTPARALIAEIVRRYCVPGLECSLLEIQKLAWFLERSIERVAPDNPLKLNFSAHKFGPYAKRLDHLLNALDGSYLHAEKRISDADPLDVIWFEDDRKDFVHAYLMSGEAKRYSQALEETSSLIDGFESPFGMELLATVDWLLFKERADPNVESIREGLRNWPGGAGAGARKLTIFDDRVIDLALHRLASIDQQSSASGRLS